MILKRAALTCALVICASIASGANDNNQTTSSWSKNSIPDKVRNFFLGIGTDMKKFLYENRLIDENKSKETNTTLIIQ